MVEISLSGSGEGPSWATARPTLHEITAIPELLHLLAIKGCIVTIDAMGCQTTIAAQIMAQGGDDLLALKGNYKKAYMAVQQHFHQDIEHNVPWRDAQNFFDAFDDSHGRLVRRRVWAITDLAPLPRSGKMARPPIGHCRGNDSDSAPARARHQ
jgi:predicted transposase YbfD/YdcC